MSVHSVELVSDPAACLALSFFNTSWRNVWRVVADTLAGETVPVLKAVDVAVLALSPLDFTLADVLKLFGANGCTDLHGRSQAVDAAMVAFRTSIFI